MSSSYSGDKSAITARQAVTITDPADADQCTAASNNVGQNKLADILKFLMDNAALITGVANAGPIDVTGASGDDQAGMKMQTTPTARKLLLELKCSSSTKARVYVEKNDDTASPGETIGGTSGGFTFTVNAAWNPGGSSWAPDDVAQSSFAMRLNKMGLKIGSVVMGGSIADASLINTVGGLVINPQLYSSVGAILGVANGGSEVQLNGPDSLAQIYMTPLIVGGTGVAFQNSWVTAPSAGYRKLSYWKDAFGAVHIEGGARGNHGVTIFTLPSGYRPSGYLSFSTLDNGDLTPDVVEIDSSGNVQVTSPTGSDPRWPEFNLVFHPAIAHV